MIFLYYNTTKGDYFARYSLVNNAFLLYEILTKTKSRPPNVPKWEQDFLIKQTKKFQNFFANIVILKEMN